MPTSPVLDPTTAIQMCTAHLQELCPQASRIKQLDISVVRSYYDAHFKTTDIVARYTVQFGMPDGSITEKEFFLKAGDTQTIKHLYYCIHFLRSQGFDTPPYLVLKPYVLEQQLGCVLFERLQGKTLRERLTTSKEKLLPLIKLSAGWLATLHNIKKEQIPQDVAWIKKQRERVDLSSFEHPFSHIETFLSQKNLPKEVSTSAITELAKKIFDYEDTLVASAEHCFVHGDFHPENMFIQAPNITVIDFLNTHIGDAFFDIGTFIVQLKNQFETTVSPTDILDLQQYFIESYQQNRPLPYAPEHIRSRILFYTILVEFNNLIHYLIEEKNNARHTRLMYKTFEDIKQGLAQLPRNVA